MRSYSYVVEKCSDTALYVCHVPGFPGAHSQADSLDELRDNMREAIELLLEGGEPQLEAEFVGTETVKVA
jgi:predicted RNase H-like HicB family nuclease